MMKKFVLGGMVVVAALLGNACGDDGSGDSPAAPADSEVSLSSSSEDAVSSSSAKDEVSSSSKKVESSSSSKTDVSSSSTKIESSSSSVNVKESSSSSKVESSSSKNEVSSSSKNVQSSSSDKPVESSSSKAKSSSSEISSSSIKIEESSSSVESSSSLNPVESSSSEMSSSSSSALNSIYDAENNTLTDLRDSRVYKTTTIGTQIWMAENLNYLPEDTVNTYFAGRSVCGGGEYRSLQEGDCSVYGRLYDKVINAYDGFNKDICPDGWRVPTMKQWQVLVEFLGGTNVAGKEMKSDEGSYWSDDSLLNSFGFSAIPSGYFTIEKGFNSRNNELLAVFTVHSISTVESNSIIIFDTKNVIQFTNYGDGYFRAIRCIKN